MLLRKIVAALTVVAAATLAAPATTAVAAPATRAERPAPPVAKAPSADVDAEVDVVASADATAADAAAEVDLVADAAGVAATTNPVIVVGGLSGFAAVYEPLAARLRADGFRVFIYELPGLGFGDITASAREFAGYVDRVRSATGAAAVDLVAHSQGGLVARYYLKRLGGTDAVGRYVSLGSPQYGTYVANILAFLGLGTCVGVVSCEQMEIGSAFLADLNAGDDTPGPVRYTTVRTLQDELVRPVGNAALADGATNVLIQAWCPLRLVGHLGLALDGTTYSVIRQALTGAPIRPNCFAL